MQYTKNDRLFCIHIVILAATRRKSGQSLSSNNSDYGDGTLPADMPTGKDVTAPGVVVAVAATKKRAYVRKSSAKQEQKTK